MNKKLKNIINLTIAFFIFLFLINMDEKNLYFSLFLKIFNDHPIKNLTVILFLIISNFYVAFFWVNLSKDENKNKELSNWLISNFGKYTPIKVGSILLRINNSSNSENKKETIKKIGIEQFLLILQGVSIIFFIFIKVNTIYKIILIVLYFFGFHYLIKNLFSKIIKIRYLYLLHISLIFNLIGISIFLETAEYTRFLDIAIIYIVSSSLSLLIFFIPAGLVVREGLFIYLSNTFLDTSNLVFIALGLRILYIVTDLILLFIGFWIKNILNEKN